MKTTKNVLTHFSLLLVLTVIIALSSCSSDDDKPTSSSNGSAASVLAGTYKGSLETWLVEPGLQNYYDVTLTVTDLKNGKIRVSANKGNSTPKDIAVSWNSDKYIVGSDTQGTITYEVSSKIINIATKSTAETDIIMTFEGTKQ